MFEVLFNAVCYWRSYWNFTSCSIGHCWCCTRWIIGNCKSPRSTAVWFCEPKDCCGWSWEVPGKLIVMNIILSVHFRLLIVILSQPCYNYFVSQSFGLDCSAGLGVLKMAIQAVAKMCGCSELAAKSQFFLIDKDVCFYNLW